MNEKKTKKGYAVIWTRGKHPHAVVSAAEGLVLKSSGRYQILKPKRHEGVVAAIYDTPARAHKEAAKEMQGQLDYENKEYKRLSREAEKHQSYAKLLHTRVAIELARSEHNDE